MSRTRDRVALAGALVGLLGLVNLSVAIAIEELLRSRFDTDFGHPPWWSMTFLIDTTQPYLVVGTCLVAFAAWVPIEPDGAAPRLAWAIPASVVVSIAFELTMYQYVEPPLETWGFRELTVFELLLRGLTYGLVLSAWPVGVMLGASALLQRLWPAPLDDVGAVQKLGRRAGSLTCAALGLLVAPLTLLTYREDHDHRSLAVGLPLAILLAAGAPLAGLVANLVGLRQRRPTELR